MSVPSTTEHAAGPVIVDVAGTVLTEHERQRLRHPAVGGVILFTRNFENRRQLVELTSAIHAARGGPLLIAVDHEGGRVQRFRADGFTALPSMAALGRLWATNPLRAQRSATEVGFVLASELRSCGVDFSFTPVLDLDYGNSQIIGTRAFSSDPNVVTQLARALTQGMALAGMAACGKHFPGHGYASADSHVALPTDDRPLQAILQHDAAPYVWLGDLPLPAIMPAHIVYSQVDHRPAGFSRIWITEILRQQLGYDGMVFSDDLTMEGAAGEGDIVARAHAALEAGCDMVLVCNRPDLADELLPRLRHTLLRASHARLQRLHPVAPAVAWDDLQGLAQYQRARTTALRLNE